MIQSTAAIAGEGARPVARETAAQLASMNRRRKELPSRARQREEKYAFTVEG